MATKAKGTRIQGDVFLVIRTVFFYTILLFEVFYDLVGHKRSGRIFNRAHCVATVILDRNGPEMTMIIVPCSDLQLEANLVIHTNHVSFDTCFTTNIELLDGVE